VCKFLNPQHCNTLCIRDYLFLKNLVLSNDETQRSSLIESSLKPMPRHFSYRSSDRLQRRNAKSIQSIHARTFGASVPVSYRTILCPVVSCPAISCPAFSCPVIWSVIFTSCNFIPGTLVLQFHVLLFHALQIGPSIHVRHFHVQHFQRPPTNSLKNAANVGHSLTFLLSTGGPMEPLDTTGATLRFREPRLKNIGLRYRLN